MVLLKQKTGVDEMGIDEMGVDEIWVDEMGCRRSGMTPLTQGLLPNSSTPISSTVFIFQKLS